MKPNIVEIKSPAVIVEPDAHGQAALLLTESLIHSLVDKRLLTIPEAMEVIEVAADVKFEVATAAGESKARMEESLELLHKMCVSFEADRSEAKAG